VLITILVKCDPTCFGLIFLYIPLHCFVTFLMIPMLHARHGEGLRAYLLENGLLG
jgi:hypothetical protein